MCFWSKSRFGGFGRVLDVLYCHRKLLHTYSGVEVDAVIGDARVAIEIKSAEEVHPRHLRGLKAFADEHPQSRRIVVSLDPFSRRMGDEECIYAPEFLAELWSKGL